ncbi:uncharacterized protein LOC114828136 [Galendromus occidentalis]|uniref:Uncharacterized protein LOC114828136 n=1 Tax=Galendromus occidentalis TaxID=34638 RepID=A0AAJ7SE76_9ACAR|nr:uncharacterized protein LOC114828136 [Galendromus occidentalis]
MTSSDEKSGRQFIQRNCLVRVARCFSARANYLRFTNTTLTPESRRLDCLHGIRALSALWILYAHVCLKDWGNVDGILTLLWMFKSPSGVILNQFVLALETFFTLLGFSLYRLVTQERKRNNMPALKLALKVILRRAVRYIVTGMGAMAVFYVLPLITSGPGIDYMYPYLEDFCNARWWSYPIFINNLWTIQDICVENQWYTAADMQIVCILILPICLLIREPGKGIRILLYLVGGSMVYAASLTYYYGASPIFLLLPNQAIASLQLLSHLHNHSLAHLSPAAVGVLGGYLIDKYREIDLGKTVYRAGWILYSAVIIAFGMGLIRWFLSRPNFIVLSRLSLSFYLMQWPALWLSMFSTRNPYSASHYQHVPEVYRMSWIAPVHKSGKRSDPANERPVSLTPVSCKILERIICRAILNHAELHGLLSTNQFAYRSARSTTDCLSTFFFTDVCPHLSDSTPVDVVYSDFKNAFERMPHGTLLSILPARGVGAKLIQWISDFLRRRTFRVKVHDVLSSPGSASVGCPQGTVCGSLLFLLFIDQLRHIVPPSVCFTMYADDVKLTVPIRSEIDFVTLQATLESFVTWSDLMGLSLSAHKCGVLHLGRRNPRYRYRLGDSDLDVLNHFKDLGVRFSESLTFSEQADHVIRKGSMLCNWILRSFSIRRPDGFLRLYQSHVVPILTYASQVWFPHKKEDMTGLERLQRQFLRRVEFRCGMLPKSLSLPSVNDRMVDLDVKYLRRLLREKIDLFDRIFALEHRRTRLGFRLRPIARNRTEKIAKMFPWRVSRLMHCTCSD